MCDKSNKEGFTDIDKMVDDLDLSNKKRDVDRIDEILHQIEIYWKENPDLRLSQIICNISQEVGIGKDPYYMEDEILSEKLNEKIVKKD